MLNRLLVLAGCLVAAAGIAALPAVIGLTGNPSFSHQLPVHVPSQARTVRLVDGASSVPVVPAVIGSRSPTEDRPHDRRATSEPGDDGGGTSSSDSGRGGASGRSGSVDDTPIDPRRTGSIADDRSGRGTVDRSATVADTSRDAPTGGSSGHGRQGDGTGHS